MFWNYFTYQCCFKMSNLGYFLCGYGLFVAGILAGLLICGFFKSKIKYIVLPKGVSNRGGNHEYS